jgi:PBSX family phage terminase large subunit
MSSIIEVDLARDFLPKQLEVLEAIEDPNTKFILYSGAFRAGKTLLLANIAIRTCIENPGCVGFLASLTYPQLRDVVFNVFKQEAELYQQALNKANVPITLITKLNTSTGNMRAEFYNGSMIYFKSCDNEMKIRGLTLDFFGLDEPIDIDETIFTQLIGRISGNVLKKPFGILTTNPGSESHWIYKRFFVDKNENYKTIKTTTYDNKLLPDYDNYIKSLQENFDDDWIRRFLDGDWGAFSGQIYKSFNPSQHVQELYDYTFDDEGILVKKTLRPEIASKIRYYIAGVDFGLRNPTCITIFGISTTKEAYLVEEWYHTGKTSRDTCEQLLKFDKQYQFKKIYVDPSALDLITQCEKQKLPVEGAINKVEPGIAKIKSLFTKNLIIIDKLCHESIRELQAYRYERDKLSLNVTEKPLKLDDHAPDSIRYALYTYNAWRSAIKFGFVKKQLWEVEYDYDRR